MRTKKRLRRDLEVRDRELSELAELARRALPFIQPRPDYAGRAYGFSELIRVALVREDIEGALERIEAIPQD